MTYPNTYMKFIFIPTVIMTTPLIKKRTDLDFTK